MEKMVKTQITESHPQNFDSGNVRVIELFAFLISSQIIWLQDHIRRISVSPLQMTYVHHLLLPLVFLKCPLFSVISCTTSFETLKVIPRTNLLSFFSGQHLPMVLRAAHILPSCELAKRVLEQRMCISTQTMDQGRKIMSESKSETPECVSCKSFL